MTTRRPPAEQPPLFDVVMGDAVPTFHRGAPEHSAAHAAAIAGPPATLAQEVDELVGPTPQQERRYLRALGDACPPLRYQFDADDLQGLTGPAIEERIRRAEKTAAEARALYSRSAR